MLEAKRTLVKSAPELWAEVSDPAALARHLAPFGSVRIKRTEPDSLVEWEGERASGAVRLEPSGFGTKVTIGATVAGPAPPDPPPADPVEEAPAAAAPRTFWARLLRRGPSEPVAVEAAPSEPEPEPEPAMPDDAALLVLTDTLDTLGRAHHRPFSRI
jgi:hypothetical protein